MVDLYLTRHVTPLSPSEYGHLRVWLITSHQVPTPPYVGAQRPSVEQAQLLLSLSCLAGIEPAQLCCIHLDDLIDADGSPADHIRLRPETSKSRVSRKVPMHPDIRRDIIAFRARHPDENWIAFISIRCAEADERRMSSCGMTQWLRSVFRKANLIGLSARSGAKMFRDSQRRAQR